MSFWSACSPKCKLALLFAGLLAARLCHSGILWAEEGYPSAAAVQLLHGKEIYRDFWFDKPPLYAGVYLLWGGAVGIPLRLAGALFVFACCLALYRFGRELWGEREALGAAGFLAFFLTFGIPSAVMALAPDLLMILPHVGAVYLAWRGKPFWSGVAAGVAMLCNTKGIFVLAACFLWQYRQAPALLAGFALPNLLFLGALEWTGALRSYYQQVWEFGLLYSKNPFAFLTGVTRTLNWAGFQSALILGAAWFWWHERGSDRARFAAWALLSLAAVTAGWRFFPRYYFQLLPVMSLAAARGCVLLGRRRAVVLLALLIPLVRFAPRYAMLAAGRDPGWSDIALDRDSLAAAGIVNRTAGSSDTLLVWGYRPDIFAYTRLAAGSFFLDSQPLTGVLADRHLTSAEVAAPELAARNRQELAQTTPTFVIDGLGPLNPALALGRYADLQLWFSKYEEIARTRWTIVYRRR